MRQTHEHPGLHDAEGRELTHRHLQVSGVRTHVVDHGEGPAVLLIHGYGDTADGWREVVPSLLEHHRVIAIDVPPFGRSGSPRTGRLMDFYRRFFPALLERLSVADATAVGHSLGGAIALRLAIDRPDLVERLCLVAPAGLGLAPPWWWRPLAGNAMLWRAALSVPSPLTPLLIREGLRRFLDWRLFHDSRERRADIEHIVDMHCAPKDFEALLSAGRACVDAYTGELLEESGALEHPVLMIWGRHDGLIPSAHADAFRRANGRAEVHVFGDCGHYPHLELPRRFNRVLGNWLGAPAAPLADREVA